MPIFLIIILILKFTGEGEVFYKQERIGKNGQRFDLLKFATMLKESPSMNNGSITIHNDPRVLPFGSFLRKTKINELPQLINILKGDMSIIGPRPMIPSTFSNYSLEVQEELKKIKPGLSGIGSVVFRDEESLLSNIETNREVFYKDNILPYKGKLELWYVKHNSMYIYFILIFLTIWIVLYPNSRLYERLLTNLPEEEIKR
jgi:lipopolysaccharide/colanic/teichoic acid biosynthesis glycosyltransferase